MHDPQNDQPENQSLVSNQAAHSTVAITVVDEQKFFLVEPLDGYAPEIGQLLSLLADARQRTMRYVDGLPPEAIDWELAPNFHTIGSILYHIAAVEVNWIYGLVLQRDMPIDVADWFPRTILDDRGDITPMRNISLDGHLYRLDKAHAIMLSAFKGMSLEAFHHVSNIPRMAVTPETVAQQLLQHEAEHRGQIMSLRTAADMYFEQKRLGIAAPSGVEQDKRPDSDYVLLPQQRPPDTEPIPKPKLHPQFRMTDNANGPHPLHRGELPELLRKRNEPRSALSRLWRKLTGQD
jgi:uncharacterized damage-inducible protein DinB